ncbi:MAG TPA: zinc ribbon domain-containing protein [Blastocatellia bacterium]|nr:zinc ribbon domain-containing protein [Blastocatellia bacterium]
MYCPSCSTQAIEGAKFCKTCGMNLGVVTQALNGGVTVTDPLRDREYKRARKQISDGIHGFAVGGAFLAGAALTYFLVPRNSYVYALALGLALFGIIKIFRSVGSIIDARVGPKLLDPALQPRGTGGLSASLPSQATPATNVRPSQRLSADALRNPAAQPANTRPVSAEKGLDQLLPVPLPPVENMARPLTGRVNREHSSPLRKPDREEDLISKLRN